MISLFIVMIYDSILNADLATTAAYAVVSRGWV